jgi:hypothetical protein
VQRSATDSEFRVVPEEFDTPREDVAVNEFGQRIVSSDLSVGESGCCKEGAIVFKERLAINIPACYQPFPDGVLDIFERAIWIR